MLTDESRKLNPWPFIAIDALLLGAAYFIGTRYTGPLPGAPLFVIGSLVFVGALIACVPFLVNYSRKQEAILEERQQQIAALAQSTSSSAEQLSIAASSLHSIADAASRAAKAAEALPQKMQEKIHEFKEQLNEVTVSENEALSQEVNTLRAAETERMEGIVTTVRKLSSEISRLEAASRKNVTELTEVLSRFTSSSGQAVSDGAAALAASRTDAERSLAGAQAAAMQAVEQSLRRGLAELDSTFATFSSRLNAHAEQIAARLESAMDRVRSAAPARLQDTPPPVQAPSTERQKEALEPDPTLAPAAPVEAANTAHEAAPGMDGHSNTTQAAEVAPEPDVSEPAKPAKKRSTRRTEDDGMMLGLDLPPLEGEDTPPAADEAQMSALSSDGVTRLLVTAYIGIGNKLFLRGDGPGLSWDKGVALQFVSIGKWRWETADAVAPFRAKLYKNDEQECGIGEIGVDPGHQCEVVAKF